MLTIKDYFVEITNPKSYLKLLLILGFIFVVSYLFSKLLQISIQTIFFVICVVMTSFFGYVTTSPLFIAFKEKCTEYRKITQNAVAKLQNEQAKCKDIESELEYLQGLYKLQQANVKELQANEKQSKQIISELQQENSELKASETNELATVKEQLSKEKEYMAIMQEGNVTRQNLINKLQQTEKFMFLVELGLTKQQVAIAVTNAVTGGMNGMSEQQKERQKEILKQAKA
jgi:hypothetical protein